MATSLNEFDFDSVTLEQPEPLKVLRDAILTRYSVTNNRYASTNITSNALDYNVVSLTALRSIKSAIESLAPLFINMDYPYWDYNWSKFPQMYSTNTIRNDAEHNLSLLPVNGMTFDDESIATYRKFLKNCAYWLQKFRYVVSDKSWYDETYRRDWEWTRHIPVWYDGPYYYTAREHNRDVPDASASTLNQLMSSGQGLVQATGGTYTSQIRVQCSSFINGYKTIHHSERRPYGPLTQFEEYNEGQTLRNIPHNLMTTNPTCYQADVSWFVVPFSYYAESSMFKELFDDLAITETDSGTTIRWGDNNEYSGIQYSSEAATNSHLMYVFRRGSEKLTSQHLYQYGYNMSGSHREILTRWSDDGERSFVWKDVTEPYSSNPTGNYLNRTEYRYPTFGNLVSPISSNKPTFNVGTVLPHETVTFHVCDQNSLPTNFPIPNVQYATGETLVWGIDSTSLNNYYGDTSWIPVLDFGDYVIPEPEEPEGQMDIP